MASGERAPALSRATFVGVDCGCGQGAEYIPHEGPGTGWIYHDGHWWCPNCVADALHRDLASRDLFDAVKKHGLMPELHNPHHEQPFKAFVQAMADELRANRDKGDWTLASPAQLLTDIQHHLVKLWASSCELQRFERDELARPLPWGEDVPDLVLEFAADVANMAMMLADSHRLLGEYGRTS